MRLTGNISRAAEPSLVPNNARPAAGFASPTVATWAMFAGVNTFLATVIAVLTAIPRTLLTAAKMSG